MSIKIGDKIKILKDNPQRAGSVKKGDVATVKTLFSTGFNYLVDSEAAMKWFWKAHYDQEGKTWEKYRTGRSKKDLEIPRRAGSYWDSPSEQIEAKTFKVGERVVVYDSRLKPMRQVATLIKLRDPNGFHPKAFYVSGVKRADNPIDELIVHPKQVRKLKLKVKA